MTLSELKSIIEKKYLIKGDFCAACGSSETEISKNGKPHWYRFEGHRICKKCYDKHIHSPETNKKWNPIHNRQKLNYKGKSIFLGKNPKVGRCELCGKKVGDMYINARGETARIKITQRHHYGAYDDNDPLKNTIEVCMPCHRKTMKSYTRTVKHLEAQSTRQKKWWKKHTVTVIRDAKGRFVTYEVDS